MKILTLSIKQKYFDEILAGTKKVETREVRPKNFKRYCRYVHNGKEYENFDDIPEEGELDLVPVEYDALKLVTSAYNAPKRPFLIVEVEKAEIFLLRDENGEDIIFEENGIEYIAADIEYHLGKITHKHL